LASLTSLNEVKPMNGKHKLFDLIQRYIRGRLSDSEREDLESRMASDPGLRTKVLIQQEAYKLAKEAEPAAEQSPVDEIQKISPATSTSSAHIFWMIVVLLIIVALLVWWEGFLTF